MFCRIQDECVDICILGMFQNPIKMPKPTLTLLTSAYFAILQSFKNTSTLHLGTLGDPFMCRLFSFPYTPVLKFSIYQNCIFFMTENRGSKVKEWFLPVRDFSTVAGRGSHKVGKQIVIFGHFRESDGPVLTAAWSNTQNALSVILYSFKLRCKILQT